MFLSYRRTNFPWALNIFQNLTHNGFDVFFDYRSCWKDSSSVAHESRVNSLAWAGGAWKSDQWNVADFCPDRRSPEGGTERLVSSVNSDFYQVSACGQRGRTTKR